MKKLILLCLLLSGCTWLRKEDPYPDKFKRWYYLETERHVEVDGGGVSNAFIASVSMEGA
jgi:hypothetical protein